MKKRDKQRERREVIHALSMILQIGLAMLTCMGISLAIGYSSGSAAWNKDMGYHHAGNPNIGVDAQPLSSLTGQYGNNGSKKEETPADQEDIHEGSKKDTP